MPTATAPAFRYTPGDGRLYTWSGDDRAMIVVHRIVSGTDPLQTVLTGDAIPAPERRTAAALMAAVDTWRGVA